MLDEESQNSLRVAMEVMGCLFMILVAGGIFLTSLLITGYGFW